MENIKGMSANISTGNTMKKIDYLLEISTLIVLSTVRIGLKSYHAQLPHGSILKNRRRL